ncbi:hypothetical protein F4703DRAFT_1869404 [Phycomyces blakesleeanus]
MVYPDILILSHINSCTFFVYFIIFLLYCSLSIMATPLSLQFQLIYHWENSTRNDDLKTCMYPTFKVNLNNVPIYRLIDYQFESHYISAGQLWKASGLTIIEGLHLFQLHPSDYQVDFLIPVFPFCDIWVTTKKARSMAASLGVDIELDRFLDPGLDRFYSSDNAARNEIVHNWKVEAIPNAMYSTRALLETEFEMPDRLTANRKIRTQISRLRQPGIIMKDRFENGLVRWQVGTYEQFIQPSGFSASGISQLRSEQRNNHNNNNAIDDDEELEDDDLEGYPQASSVWDVLQGLLCDLQTLRRQGVTTSNNIRESRVLSDTMLVGNIPLKREYLGQSMALQNMYIAVMAEKIYNEIQGMATESRTEPGNKNQNQNPNPNENENKNKSKKGIEIEREEDDDDLEEEEERSVNKMMLHDRMDFLEQSLYRMSRKSRKKVDEVVTGQQELENQILALEQWRSKSELARKSERVWMFMVMLSILIGSWVLR